MLLKGLPEAMGLLNLDTHILIHALDDTLLRDERILLSGNSWGISAIVLWEIAKLVQLDRLTLNMQSPEFTRVFARVHVWPLDIKVCRQSTNLDFQSDPPDELIAATSIVHDAPLVTRDSKILGSKMVPLASSHAVIQ